MKKPKIKEKEIVWDYQMDKLILVIDDSNVVQTNLKIILEKANYDYRKAYNGLEAQEVLNLINNENKKPSLILCDVNMP